MENCTSTDAMRPHRSDAHLSLEEEAKREEETREYFHELAPKRHTKPSRSEHSAVYSDLNPSDQDPTPEFERLQSLEADTQKISCDGSEAIEEYVATEYYKDLNCVDKQHHTTGSGFICVEKSCDSSFELIPDASVGSDSHPSSKGNPATNEWIPSADPVIQVSDKPNRSDA